MDDLVRKLVGFTNESAHLSDSWLELRVHALDLIAEPLLSDHAGTARMIEKWIQEAERRLMVLFEVLWENPCNRMKELLR